jgi:apolipoprotein N-acyltransferase
MNLDLHSIQRPGLLGHFFALVCGALIPFSFEPYNLWPLQIVAISLFYFSIKDLSSRQAMWRGWWLGLGLFASGVSWVYVSIHDFSNTPAPLAALMTLLFVMGLAWFFAFMTMFYQYFFADKKLTYLSFAAVWILFEWSRSWFLSGFPWLFLGDAHINSSLKGFAPVFGVYSIGFIITLMSAYIVDAYNKAISSNSGSHNFKNIMKNVAPILLAPWVVGAFLSIFEWTEKQADVQVVAIQGNIPQERKWLPEEIYPTLEKYRSASEKNWDADVILWPETAITVLHHQAKEYMKYLNDEGKKTNTALITGIPYQQGKAEAKPGRYHNSIVGLGDASGLYHKNKLVPFGEYMPLPDSWRPLLSFFNIPMSQFVGGQLQQDPIVVNAENLQYNIAPFVCYDVVYPDYVAAQSKDSGMIITISNDAWFGLSNGPLQHLGIVKMRAVENGRYILRSTNTGVTALIDNRGQVVDQLPQMEFGVLRAKAEIRTGNTPFNIWGSWPILLFCFVLLTVITLKGRDSEKGADQKKGRSPETQPE